MPTITDTITTPDGSCPVTLAMPDGAGPWPGIVMYPDAGGVRPALQGMAARLAALRRLHLQALLAWLLAAWRGLAWVMAQRLKAWKLWMLPWVLKSPALARLLSLNH
jgi:hypothetical protein